LRRLQERFAAAVLRRADPAELGLRLRPADARLARRLQVYRVNSRENFAAALESAYPVLRAELGDEEFRSLAWSYQRQHPSRSGNLYEVGRRLPHFLEPHVRASPREYLHDLARLEWAVQEALVAADAGTAFDAGTLAGVPASEHARLAFSVHPSVRIVHARHPVFALWQALHAGTGRARAPAPAEAGTPERILVRRAGEGIEIFLLGEMECCCLECLLAGGTLGEITDAALAVDEAPDVGAVLVRWAKRGVVTGLRPPVPA
jgi:hypothetical protein